MNPRFWILAPALMISLVVSLFAKPVPPDLLKKRDSNELADDPLPAGAVGRVGTLRLRHAAHMLAYSPDGRLLASTGIGTRLFDARSGRHLRDLEGSSSYVGFSSDSSRLFSMPYGFKPVVQVWNLDNGMEREKF